jgi:Bacterial regulatory protein, Fis family
VLCTELVRQGISAAGANANDLHDRIVGRVERELIQQVLQTCDRVQIKAAARLGINRNTLHKKLAEYRLDESDPGAIIEPPAISGGRRNSNGAIDELDENEPDKDDSRSRPYTREPEPARPTDDD